MRQINTIIVQNCRHSRNRPNLTRIQRWNHDPKQIQQLSRSTMHHGRKCIQLFGHGGLYGLIEGMSDEFKSFLGSGGDGAALKEEGGEGVVIEVPEGVQCSDVHRMEVAQTF